VFLHHRGFWVSADLFARACKPTVAVRLSGDAEGWIRGFTCVGTAKNALRAAGHNPKGLTPNALCQWAIKNGDEVIVKD